MKSKLISFRFSAFGYTLSFGDILSNPLFSGSFIMIFGTNFANFIAYLYHVVFGRFFTPSQYGELAATFSIIGMVSSAITFFSLVVIKFVSSAANKDEQGKYLRWFLHRGLILGVLLCLSFVFFTSSLSEFLHVSKNSIYLIGPILFFSLISLIFKSFLQGVIKFKENVIVTNVEILGRLLFGLVFVYLGYQVFGAMIGFLVSNIVGMLWGRWYLSSYSLLGKEERGIDTQKIVSYSIPILLSSLAANSLLSMDLVLVKHFFSAEDAGIYAAVGTLGKMIFYGTSPVAAVMFPLVSRKHANGEKYLKVFFLSLLITLAIALGVLILFSFIPNLIVDSVYGRNKYINAGSYLLIYGIFITLFTLCTLILNFYLSVGKTKLIILSILAAGIQIVGIWLFHNSLSNVIIVSIISSSFFLVSLLLYFFLDTRKNGYRKKYL